MERQRAHFIPTLNVVRLVRRSLVILARLGFLSVYLSSCTTPTLVQVARRRQGEDAGWTGSEVKNDVRVKYEVTDWDVLNFTDEVKRKLANRSRFHMGVRYGSSGAQATLGALAAAAKTFGWGVATASGLGLGATYIFGMGQIFDAKGHAQAYEQAFTAIQAAEATFYFHQVGMGFKEEPAKSGKFIIDLSHASLAGAAGIPTGKGLTPDGETLYYKVTKILKVMEDVLANKIPDLQDLKDAKGDTSGTTSPAVPSGAPANSKPAFSPSPTHTNTATTALPGSTSTPTPSPAP